MCFILCIQTIFHMTHTYHCHSSSQMPAKTNIKLSLISCHKSWVYRTMLSHIFEYIKIYNKFPKYSQDIILVKVSTSLILFEYNISTESVTGSFNFIASYILDVWLKGEISHIHTHTTPGTYNWVATSKGNISHKHRYDLNTISLYNSMYSSNLYGFNHRLGMIHKAVVLLEAGTWVIWPAYSQVETGLLFFQCQWDAALCHRRPLRPTNIWP